MGTISILKTNNPSFNNGGTIRSKEYNINDIILHPKFQRLFKIDDNVLERITNSIKESGFDITQPLHLFEIDGKLFILDGYTRYFASLKAKIEFIPCHVHTEIKSFEEAYQYALRLQINRRNLSSLELLKIVEMLSTEYQEAKDDENRDTGRIVEKIAEEIHLSPRTVQKYQTINNEASEEVIQEITDGKTTVNKAYEEIQRKKKEGKLIPSKRNTDLSIEDTKTKITRILNDIVERIEQASTPKELVDAFSFIIAIFNKEIRDFSL